VHEGYFEFSFEVGNLYMSFRDKFNIFRLLKISILWQIYLCPSFCYDNHGTSRLQDLLVRRPWSFQLHINFSTSWSCCFHVIPLSLVLYKAVLKLILFYALYSISGWYYAHRYILKIQFRLQKLRRVKWYRRMTVNGEFKMKLDKAI